MIKLEKVFKYYTGEGGVVKALDNINLEIKENEFITITGESGSGKSTLLNVISGIDTYEAGVMYIDGEDTTYYSQEDWENYRRSNVGFIFQNYNLVDSFSVYQNVVMTLIIQGLSPKERKRRALNIIERVGLKKRIKTKASKLSGGEKQRLAIARVLAKDTKIIVADEPTGNLDKENSHDILSILHEIAKEKLVVVVSHSYDEMKEFSTRHIRLFDGKIIEDIKTNASIKPKEINILKEEIKVKKVRRGFLLATMNLFSQPKKALFMFMTAFVTIFLITLGFGAINASTRKSIFSTTDPTYEKAYYVGPKQNDKATNNLKKTDYEYLKSKGSSYNISYGETYGMYAYFYKNGSDMYDEKTATLGNVTFKPFEEYDNKRQLYLGRKPQEKDEAVVTEAFYRELKEDHQKLIESGELLISAKSGVWPDGTKIAATAPVIEETIIKRTTVKVVGVVRNIGDTRAMPLVFLQQESYRNFYLFKQFLSKTIEAVNKKLMLEYEGTNDSLQKKDILFTGQIDENIVFTHLLEKDEVSYNPEFYKLFKNGEGKLKETADTEYTTEVMPVVKRVTIKSDDTTEEKKFTNKQSVYDDYMISHAKLNSKTLFLSESIYDEVLELFDEVNKVIFYPKGDDKKILEELKEEGYVFESVKSEDDESQNLNKIVVSILRFFIFLIVLGVYYISYLIFRIILRSKNSEYKIMKILGLPSASVGLVIVFEMLWTFLITFACVVGMFLSLSFFKESELYRAFGALFVWYDYIVLFVLCFLVFGFVVLRYYRALNKKKLVVEARGK